MGRVFDKSKLTHLYNVEYPNDKTVDQIVSRGIIDPYDMSDEPDEWAVLMNYIFWSARYQVFIVIPRWFVTDLASIPKYFRRIISVNERHRLAALPHDFGYWFNRHFPELNPFTREQWDMIFKDFCEMQQVRPWKVCMLHTGVRVGGWASYNKSTGPEPKTVKEVDRRRYIEWFPTLMLDPSSGNYGVFQ